MEIENLHTTTYDPCMQRFYVKAVPKKKKKKFGDCGQGNARGRRRDVLKNASDTAANAQDVDTCCPKTVVSFRRIQDVCESDAVLFYDRPTGLSRSDAHPGTRRAADRTPESRRSGFKHERPRPRRRETPGYARVTRYSSPVTVSTRRTTRL